MSLCVHHCPIITSGRTFGLRGPLCQLVGDGMGGKVCDSEQAENEITSSMTRDSALAVSQSSPAVYQITSNAQCCGWQLDGYCVRYQPGISPYEWNQVFSSTLFCSSLSSTWKVASASSPLPRC